MHSSVSVSNITESPPNTCTSYSELIWCGPTPEDNYNENYVPGESWGHGGGLQHPYYELHSVHQNSSIPPPHPHGGSGHFVVHSGPRTDGDDCCSADFGPHNPSSGSPVYGPWNCHSSNSNPYADHHHHLSGHPSPELDEDPLGSPSHCTGGSGDILVTGGPRPTIRRRNTANKKERRRTQSINNAFAELRDCIPNVPSDTKLSEFISYLCIPLPLLSLV